MLWKQRQSGTIVYTSTSSNHTSARDSCHTGSEDIFDHPPAEGEGPCSIMAIDSSNYQALFPPSETHDGGLERSVRETANQHKP